MKPLALLILLLTALAAAPTAHAAQPKLSGVPKSVVQGGSFTVKVKTTKKVALSLAAGKKVTRLATLKAKKGKASGKVTITAAPGAYQLRACVGKACATKALKVTAKPAPAPAPTSPA